MKKQGNANGFQRRLKALSTEIPAFRPLQERAKAVAVEVSALRPTTLKPAVLFDQLAAMLNGAVRAIREQIFPGGEKVLIPIIGENARTVWRALEKKGTTDIETLRKTTKLSEKMLCLAVGWLAREGRVRFEKNRRQILVGIYK